MKQNSVYERAMPATGDGRILIRYRQGKGPIAGMARSYTNIGQFQASDAMIVRESFRFRNVYAVF